MCEQHGKLADYLFRDEIAFAEYYNYEDAEEALHFFKGISLFLPFQTKA